MNIYSKKFILPVNDDDYFISEIKKYKEKGLHIYINEFEDLCRKNNKKGLYIEITDSKYFQKRVPDNTTEKIDFGIDNARLLTTEIDNNDVDAAINFYFTEVSMNMKSYLVTFMSKYLLTKEKTEENKIYLSMQDFYQVKTNVYNQALNMYISNLNEKDFDLIVFRDLRN